MGHYESGYSSDYDFGVGNLGIPFLHLASGFHPFGIITVAVVKSHPGYQVCIG